MWIAWFRLAIGWLVRTEERFTTKVKNERAFTTKFTKDTKVLKSKSFFTTKGTKIGIFGVGPRYLINISGLSLQK